MSDDAKHSVKADEAWKDRVKTEDAALEATLKAEAATKASEGADAAPVEASAKEPEGAENVATTDGSKGTKNPTELPPPDFSMLIQMLSTQAMIGLGMFADPATEDSGPQLHLAKHFIDLLGVLEQKTKRNLTGHEDQLLQGTLHELRMMFVEVKKAETKQPE
ncbi:MAG: DUF1844 domain-containing protein [Planctomycetaceae bacterium]